MTDELHRYRLVVNGKDIEGLCSVNSDNLSPVTEIGSGVATFEHRHSERRALYEWMKEVAEPEEPWTFDVCDETQGPDWFVVYTKSQFTGMERVPGGNGVSISVSMVGRDVWFRCPHGMISDEETEAMFIADRARGKHGRSS